MAIGDDFSVAVNGDIRYTGDAHGGASPGYYTVIAFHRWLQDLADDAVATPDDILDISDTTPSERATDNLITLLSPYNIDQTASEHLYDGSVVQAGGDDIWDGVVNFGNTSKINVLQEGARVTNDFWNSFTPLGFNDDAAQGISHRFMIKTRTAGADLDGRRLLGLSRQFGKTYSEFPINGTSRGNNVLALSEADDLNNATAIGTIAGYTDIVNDNEGYVGIDGNGDTTNEFYYSDWELGSRTKNDFYERLKWLTRDAEATTIYGLAGEIFRGITHEIDIDTPTGTFVEPEEVTWAGGGRAQLLAIDSVTAGTKMWIQLLEGSPPADGVTITGAGGGTADVNVTVVERTVSTPFVGASTGSAIIGAYGLGIGADDLGASDRVFDLTNTQIIPPNNVTFTVSGLVSGEDRVLVGPEALGVLEEAQFTVATTALTTANITSVEINTTIPSDTPSTGTVRVADNAGVFRRLIYTSYTGATFTIDPTASEADVPNVADFDTTNASIGNSVFISYIDELASAAQATFTSVYSADRDLFVRVRDGGTAGDAIPIKTFETTGTLTDAGGNAVAIRTSDA